MQILGRISALSRLLDQTCARVAALDPERDAPAMLEQMISARTDLRETMEAAIRDASPRVAAVVRYAMGAGVITTLKEIPGVIDSLVSKINARSTPPALQCALISVLAYVVQPREIVPDDAPGGYGFIDDSALLTATQLQLLEPTAESADAIEALKQRLASVQTILPESAIQPMVLAIQGTLVLFETMQKLSPQIVATTTQQLLDNPLKVMAPQVPPEWKLPRPTPGGAGHWSGGAYFEGGNVIASDGTSLISGQMFIPG